jgi:hypothetical protein
MTLFGSGEVQIKVGVVVLALCSATGLGQAPPKHRPTPAPEPKEAKCIAEMASTIPTRVINEYSNSAPDNMTSVYSDGKVDVYTDQRVIDAYIQYPAPYSGEFSGPLYFVFRDEAMRQSIIKRIRNSRPTYFNRNMTCPDFDSSAGGSIRHNQDCDNGGPSRNLDFLKYIAADITFSTRGPGNVLLPPGATMPSRLFIIGTALYLSSPRCADLSVFDKTVAKSIPPDEEYIDALGQAAPNSTLIGETYGGSNRNEFMALFMDSSTKIATTVLPGDYQVGEADESLLSRSVKGAGLKITDGRRK